MNVTYELGWRLPIIIDNPFSCITPSGKGFATAIAGAIAMDAEVHRELRVILIPAPTGRETGDD